MSDYFHEKTFLVTGASSGIGWSLAGALVKRGAFVVAMARREQQLNDLQEEFGKAIIPFPGDVTVREDCEGAVKAALDEKGALHGLIHNAGISMRGTAHTSQEAVFRQLMDVNFFSMIHLYHATFEHLVKTKGHLVAISSVMGRYATHERSGYCASKHALQGFMDSVRLEILEKGIHTLVVSPGFVRTNISFNALDQNGIPFAKDGAATANGLDPDIVASQILNAIEKRKRDFYPAGPKEKFGLFMSKWAPGFLDRILLKIQIK